MEGKLTPDTVLEWLEKRMSCTHVGSYEDACYTYGTKKMSRFLSDVINEASSQPPLVTQLKDERHEPLLDQSLDYADNLDSPRTPTDKQRLLAQDVSKHLRSDDSFTKYVNRMLTTQVTPLMRVSRTSGQVYAEVVEAYACTNFTQESICCVTGASIATVNRVIRSAWPVIELIQCLLAMGLENGEASRLTTIVLKLYADHITNKARGRIARRQKARRMR